MDPNGSKRCTHFQIFSEPLDPQGPGIYLAIRRCLMTERMIVLLKASEGGSELAEKLIVNATNGKSFAFVGPDLEAVSQRGCTIRRCDERCTPAYKQNLDHFSIIDPRLDEVTCDDESPQPRDDKHDSGEQSIPALDGDTSRRILQK